MGPDSSLSSRSAAANLPIEGVAKTFAMFNARIFGNAFAFRGITMRKARWPVDSRGCRACWMVFWVRVYASIASVPA